ncbi:MAG: oligopeptide transport system substrate-binding protein [Chloroflexota bacterium]|nr:oligopeptide transport system substrate-binding protein [Chloroflexota bacterium]
MHGARRFVRAGLGRALLLSMLLVACQSPASRPAPSGTAPSPSGDQPASPNLAARQEFTFNIGAEPPGLDPQYTEWDQAIAVLLSTFDGLLRFDPDLHVRPAIAREDPSLSNGDISADGLTYTFKLRNDVKWSDGKPLTAQDFDYGIRRLFDPDKGSQYASFYFVVAGGEEYFTARGTKDQPKNPSDAELQALRSAIGVKAVDDYTLQIQLKAPRASFLELAALWPMDPIRADVVQQFGDRWIEGGNMVSTGAFKLAEWVHNDHLTLVPNDFYYGDKAKLQKLTLRIVTDSSADYAAYLNGEVDGVRVPLANIQQAQTDDTLRAQLKRAPRLTTYAFQFNNRRAPFDNKLVRQAFSQAVDREVFIQQVQRGVGQAAYSWVPPRMPGYQPDLGRDVNKFDPTAAKRLLADAGYPNGSGLPPISFQYASTGDNPTRAQFLQAQLKDNLGVDLTLEPMETASFSRLVNANQHQFAFVGWGADYPDPDNWLPEIFGTTGGNNHTQYSNPQLDQIMRQAISEPDENRRLQLWNQAQAGIVQDVPMIFLVYTETFILMKPYVQGLVLTGMDGTALPGRHFTNQLYISQ